MQSTSIIPLRVDLAGGWLDVPKLSRPGAFIINCTILPGLEYKYEYGGGLGGSAAFALRQGKNAFETEAEIAGWQDPAIILETGLCAWRSGPEPVLEMKVNPDFLKGRMAIWWTGKPHKQSTHELMEMRRDYDQIELAAKIAMYGVMNRRHGYPELIKAVRQTYLAQLAEGMDQLPPGGVAHKYLGSGHGGYALYLFNDNEQRNCFVLEKNGLPIEPYMKPVDGEGSEV